MTSTTRTALRTATAARGTLDCYNAVIALDEALQSDQDPVCAKASRELNAYESPADAIRAAVAVLR